MIRTTLQPPPDKTCPLKQIPKTFPTRKRCSSLLQSDPFHNRSNVITSHETNRSSCPRHSQPYFEHHSSSPLVYKQDFPKFLSSFSSALDEDTFPSSKPQTTTSNIVFRSFSAEYLRKQRMQLRSLLEYELKCARSSTKNLQLVLRRSQKDHDIDFELHNQKTRNCRNFTKNGLKRRLLALKHVDENL